MGRARVPSMDSARVRMGAGLTNHAPIVYSGKTTPMFGYLSSAGLLCFALTSLSLTGAGAVQQVQTKSVDALIEQAIGRESVVNCGEYAISTPHSKEALLKSLACAEDSVKQNKPSRIVVHLQGIDSLVAHGVLSDATGQAFFFSFDSAPCGAPGSCAERFDKKPCRVSDVEVLAMFPGYYRLGLKQ